MHITHRSVRIGNVDPAVEGHEKAAGVPPVMLASCLFVTGRTVRGLQEPS